MMPSARVLNSGGPPITKFFATGVRSEIDVRWSVFAVAAVTVTESLSSADEELRISTDDGSFAVSAAFTSAVDTALLVLSTDAVRKAPLYSGMTVIAPETTCG